MFRAINLNPAARQVDDGGYFDSDVMLDELFNNDSISSSSVNGAGGAAGSRTAKAGDGMGGDSEKVGLDDAAPSSVLIVLPRLNDSGHTLPVSDI